MVAFRFLALLLIAAPLFAESESTERFVTECSKSKIYQGESVVCHFSLYSFEDRVDVEVAKFPEFRGYWSENSALRQGPMFLLPDPDHSGFRKALIGTYTLTPMMGIASPKITPMRLVVRSSRAQSEGHAMSSQLPALTVLPLPPPSSADKAAFTGAVGHFSLRQEAPVVRYFAKEPTAVRFFLSGSGNFPEVNTLPVQLPDGVRLLSQKSSINGTGFQTKQFEWVITIDSDTAIELPAVRLVAFNPNTRKYESLYTDPIRLDPMTRPPDMDEKQRIDWGPAEKTWSEWKPIEKSALFWTAQGLLAALWIGLFLHRLQKKRADAHARDPWVKLQAQWKRLLSAPFPEPREWLRQADALCFDTVQAQKAGFAGPSLGTRRDAVKFARTHYGEDAAQAVDTVFKTWEVSSYAPHPPPVPEEKTLLSLFVRVARDLASRKAPRA